MIKLFQKAKTGKVKYIEFWTEGKFFCRRWGTTDSKAQETRKECEGMNVGKANETSPEQQAIVEMEAKVEKKMKEGYRKSIEEIEPEVTNAKITLDNLPKEFCPCKPISKCPDKIKNDFDTYGQRKHNGHCVILVKTETGMKKVYSRRMEDITEYLDNLPPITETFAAIPNGTMLLTEFVYKDNKTNRESPREVAKLVRKKDKAEVLQRYSDGIKTGVYFLASFDLMFYRGDFIGDKPYRSFRYALLAELQGETRLATPVIIDNWKAQCEKAKAANWEGFVLRNDKQSAIHYTLNGKADRAGSWKEKFLHEDDFVVTGAEKGKAGKHTGLYAQFHIAQYNSQGELVGYGNCGPGKLSHDRLREVTEIIDKGGIKFPFVIEVEYQSRQEDSGKLEFPQFVRVRTDKTPEECICNEYTIS